MKERDEHLFSIYYVLCISDGLNSLFQLILYAIQWRQIIGISFTERQTGSECLNNHVTQLMKELGFIIRVSGSKFYALWIVPSNLCFRI